MKKFDIKINKTHLSVRKSNANLFLGTVPAQQLRCKAADREQALWRLPPSLRF
jgi:hypothetical protein